MKGSSTSSCRFAKNKCGAAVFLLEQLNLADFRNCESGEFHFSGEKVVFTGPNGTGKTNLLESIYFLSILRSFRSASDGN